MQCHLYKTAEITMSNRGPKGHPGTLAPAIFPLPQGGKNIIFPKKVILLSPKGSLYCRTTKTMEDLHRTLATYAYNILGSMEDARDVVQDVLEKYIAMDPSRIGDARNYLIKAAINQAINLKKRKAYESTYGKWLPEPVEVHTPDSPLIREQTASYSLLVLMEKLNPLERAVFILK